MNTGLSLSSQEGEVARNVNLWTTNWQWAGNKVPVDKATVDVRLEWINDAGVVRDWEGTLTFPNDLADVPVPWLKDMLIELMLRVAQKKLGMGE